MMELQFYQKIFNNRKYLSEEFYNAYFKMLRKLSNEKYLSSFFDDYDQKINDNLNKIYSEFPLEDRIFEFGPGHYKFNSEIFYFRQKMIRSKLKNLGLEVSYISNDDENIILNFASDNISFPVEIIGLKVNGELVEPEDENLIVPTKLSPQKTQNYIFNFKINSKIKIESLNNFLDRNGIEVKVRFFGDSKINTLKVNKWRKKSDSIISQNNLKSGSNFENFDFIKKSEGNVLFFVQDSININKKVVIPKGYVVDAYPGTTLNLTDSAFIISKSPFLFKGIDKNPIKVISSDQTGQGIFLYQTDSGRTFLTQHLQIYQILHIRNGNYPGP